MDISPYADRVVIATRVEQAPHLRRRSFCPLLPATYFEEEAAFEVLLESLDDEDDLLFDSDLELFEPAPAPEPEPESEPELDSDFFSALDSDLDSDFDPFSEDSESEPLPEAPFDARLSVT